MKEEAKSFFVFLVDPFKVWPETYINIQPSACGTERRTG